MNDKLHENWFLACKEIIDRCVDPSMYANARAMLDIAMREALAASKQEPNEADDLLRRLGLDPETYRTDGGYINHMKVRAAILLPESYPRIDQCQHEFVHSADLGGRVCKLCGKPERVGSKQEPQRCGACDGTGDVHRSDGEYLGVCPYCKQEPQAQVEEWLVISRNAEGELVTSTVYEPQSQAEPIKGYLHLKPPFEDENGEDISGEYIPLQSHREAIAKKDAALDACEKDAARYRWICQQDHKDRQWMGGFEEFKAARDKAIDAAITQSKEARQ